MAASLADVIVPGLPKLATTALAPASFEREVWADALNRAQTDTGKPCKIQYSHGTPGGMSEDGKHYWFGGSMIYHAWCACGRFRFHGEEQPRRYAIKAHRAWVALGVLDIVRLHWSTSDLNRAEFVIVATDGDQLTLEDVEWGDRHTTVHRAQVEPAGRSWAALTCGHPRYCRRSTDGACMHYDCKER